MRPGPCQVIGLRRGAGKIVADMSVEFIAEDPRPPVIIIGAGLAGLVAANALSTGGRRAVVLDKGTSVGGRLATRRLNGRDGRTARLDHGAQFFTVRSPDFADLVHEWRRAGVVREWCRGFSGAGDGYPRYCAEGGMSTIAKLLAATADVTCDVEARAIAGFDGSLSVSTEDGRRWESDTVIVTSPVPQSLALCENGWLALPDDAEESLRAVTYAPCFALLVTLDRPSLVPYPGGLQLTEEDDDVFSFVGDNMAKDISEVPALTFHVHDAVSRDRFDEDLDTLRTYFLDAARHYFGDAQPLSVALKRWKYARPLVGHHGACLPVEPIPGTTLVFAGDAFGGAKIEGAALSGLAAAEAVLVAT
jgi:renalase